MEILGIFGSGEASPCRSADRMKNNSTIFSAPQSMIREKLAVQIKAISDKIAKRRGFASARRLQAMTAHIQ